MQAEHSRGSINGGSFTCRANLENSSLKTKSPRHPGWGWGVGGWEGGVRRENSSLSCPFPTAQNALNKVLGIFLNLFLYFILSLPSSAILKKNLEDY